MNRLAVPALLAVLLPTRLPAQPAQIGHPSPPVVIPTRDVDITYRIAEGRIERMRWQISEQKLRVDPPLDGAYVIVDLATHRFSFVRIARKEVTDTMSGLPVPAPGPGGFVRAGTAIVAGLPCTEWSTAGANDSETVSCLTGDGVLLRSRVRKSGGDDNDGHDLLLEATRVTYGPANPAMFVIPDDFTHTSPDSAGQ